MFNQRKNVMYKNVLIALTLVSFLNISPVNAKMTEVLSKNEVQKIVEMLSVETMKKIDTEVAKKVLINIAYSKVQLVKSKKIKAINAE
jgi:hypothetical protein